MSPPSNPQNSALDLEPQIPFQRDLLREAPSFPPLGIAAIQKVIALSVLAFVAVVVLDLDVGKRRRGEVLRRIHRADIHPPQPHRRRPKDHYALRSTR